MVIYEIKNPTGPQPTPPKPPRQDIDPVFAIEMAERVRRFKRIMTSGGPERRSTGLRFGLDEETGQTVREMVSRVNQDLAKSGIAIHLLLARDDNGFYLDVYDCSGGESCEVIGDIVIGPDDLPGLLRKLQSETGFLVDGAY